MKRLLSKVTKIAGLLVAMTAALLMTGCGSKTIDLDDYVTVEFSGYDGLGKARAYFDSDSLIADYGDEVEYTKEASENAANVLLGMFSSSSPIEAMYNRYIDYGIDIKDNLSNGDVVTLTWDCDDDAIDESFNYKVKYSDITFTVEGLEEAESFDPFDYIEVTFEGISPSGKVNITKSDDEEVKNLNFTPSKRSVSNGDIITISVDYAKTTGDIVASCIRDCGMYPDKLEKTYEVSGLDEYVTSASQISDDLLAQMKQQEEDTIWSVTSGWDPGFTLDMSYAGNYFLTAKATDQKTQNMLVLVYKLHYEIELLDYDTQENVPFEYDYYYMMRFDNLVNTPDGETYTDLSSYAKTTSTFSVTTDYKRTRNSYYRAVFTGYDTLDEITQLYPVKYLETYTYENNIVE